jgi:hypothetical protein
MNAEINILSEFKIHIGGRTLASSSQGLGFESGFNSLHLERENGKKSKDP